MYAMKLQSFCTQRKHLAAKEAKTFITKATLITDNRSRENLRKWYKKSHTLQSVRPSVFRGENKTQELILKFISERHKHIFIGR